MVKNDRTATRTDLSGDAVAEISSNLRRLLADVFALYVKPKKHSLAHERAALSRLSSAARRTSHANLRDD